MARAISIRLRKNRPLGAGPPGQKAFSWFVVSTRRNAADRDLVLFQEFIEIGAVREMTQRKAAMNLGLIFALGREIGEEIIELVDRARVFFAKLQSSLEKTGLNFAEPLTDAADEIRAGDARFFARI